MYYDDLPFWSFFGRVDRNGIAEPDDYRYLLFTHFHFDILYNKEHVIEISARIDTDFEIDLTEDKEVNVEFTYTVKWKETNILFEKRMENYYSSSPHTLRIHWFAVMNSCWTVLILLGCLVMFYVRVLKKDINNMVFIIMLGLVGVCHPYSRGTLLTALVVVYTITSGIAGYTAVSLYCQLEGTNWVRNLLLTGCLFCGPLFLTFCFLNTVAITYRATAALPLGTILVLFSIWVLGASPLLLLGGIAAKNSESEFQAPCHTTKCPREIPSQRWYRGILPQMAVAGILPFGVINIELYYLFASIWGYRIYTIYAILFIVFIILVIVTAFATVALTYFQLAAEDHEWWWRSFLCGGSTGLFIYGYCLHYYYARSDMSGLLQISFFFGYMALICYGIFLMLGTIGFRASMLFVRHIYGSIKCE